jgi:hypothetical protein
MQLLTKYKKQQAHILYLNEKVEALQAEIKRHEALLDLIEIDKVKHSQLISEALSNAGIENHYVLTPPAGTIFSENWIKYEVMIDDIKTVVSLDLDTCDLLINNNPVTSNLVLK